MSKLKENERICAWCKHYDSDNCYCVARGKSEIYEEDACDGWEDCEATEEELEARAVDAAERENHRADVEGEIV